MKQLKFGIVGCGRIFNKHLNSILELDSAKLHAVCDTNKCKTDKLLTTHNITAYRNYEDLVNDPEVDVINICTPSGLHAEMAIKALENGKHVILEKPMALKMSEAHEIIQARNRNNKSLTVILQNRFNPPISLVKKHQERLGRLLHINASVYWYRPQDYYNDGWHGTKKMDGGALVNQGTHYIDMIAYFMDDDPTEVFAAGGTFTHSMECEDAACLIIKFADGRFCSLQANTIAYPENFEGSIVLFFEKATIKIAGKALDKIEYWKGELEDLAHDFCNNSSNDIYGNGHAKQISNFAQHVLNGEKLLVPAEEGLRSLAVIEKAYGQIFK